MWCLSWGAPARPDQPRGATLPSLRDRGLWAGPFLYNEGRCPGAPSHGLGSLVLPTNLEAPWPPGYLPACARQCPPAPPPAQGRGVQRQGPRQPAPGLGTQQRWQPKSCRSLLQNWACPESQPPVAPGEASAVQRGAVRWGQSTAAGPGPRVPLPGARLPPLCPQSPAALCPRSGFAWCTCRDCPVLGSEGLPLPSCGVGTGFLPSPQESPAEVGKYHPLSPLGFQRVTSASQCHRTHAGRGC